jgi:hypothetical protein
MDLYYNKHSYLCFRIEEDVDVDGDVVIPVPPYDVNKVRPLMQECETHVNFVRREEDGDADEWEERVSRYVIMISYHRCNCISV